MFFIVQMYERPVDLHAVSDILKCTYLNKKQQAMCAKRKYSECHVPIPNLPTPQPSDSESDEFDLPLRKRICPHDCELARVSKTNFSILVRFESIELYVYCLY